MFFQSCWRQVYSLFNRPVVPRATQRPLLLENGDNPPLVQINQAENTPTHQQTENKSTTAKCLTIGIGLFPTLVLTGLLLPIRSMTRLAVFSTGILATAGLIHHIGLVRIETTVSKGCNKIIKGTKALFNSLHPIFFEKIWKPYFKDSYDRGIGMMDNYDLVLISLSVISSVIINRVAYRALGSPILPLTIPLGFALPMGACLYVRYRIMQKHNLTAIACVNAFIQSLQSLKMNADPVKIEADVIQLLSEQENRPEFAHLQAHFAAIKENFKVFMKALSAHASFEKQRTVFIATLKAEIEALKPKFSFVSSPLKT